MSLILQNLFNGLVASAVYLLVGAGITFVFGLTRLINFAHGQFLVLAAFVAYELSARGVPFVGAAVGAVVAAGLIGWASERLLFRFTNANPYNGLIVGLGLLLVLEALTLKIWGGFPIGVPAPLEGGAEVGGAFLSWNRLAVLVTTVVVVVALLRLLKGSRIGRQLRAAHENPVAAAHVGITVDRMATWAFVGGSALAGLAGAFLATLQPLGAFDGHGLILKGFAVALLGGLGNLSGALKASLLYGIGETFVAGYLQPDLVPIFTYGVIVVVLLFRPNGLFEKGPAEPSLVRNAIGRLRPMRPLRRGERVVAVVLALAAAPLAFELAPSSHIRALLVLAALYAVQVYALAYVYETTGILSIAQAGLMTVGAYSAGLLSLHAGWGFWPGLLAAVVATTLVGGLLGVVIARCSGHYLLLVTLAFSALVTQVVLSAAPWTNGDNGIILDQSPPEFGPVSFGEVRGQFYVIVAVVVVAAAGLVWLKRTAFGRMLAAVRENEALARSLGLRVGVVKTAIFALSGAVSAVGGVLYLYSQSVIVPAAFETALSIEIVIMLVLGGKGLVGPALGAALFVVLPELVGLDPVDRQLVFGIGLIVVILLMPDGVVPTLRALYHRLRDGRSRPPVSDEPALVAPTTPARRPEEVVR